MVDVKIDVHDAFFFDYNLLIQVKHCLFSLGSVHTVTLYNLVIIVKSGLWNVHNVSDWTACKLCWYVSVLFHKLYVAFQNIQNTLT